MMLDLFNFLLYSVRTRDDESKDDFVMVPIVAKSIKTCYKSAKL